MALAEVNRDLTSRVNSVKNELVLRLQLGGLQQLSSVKVSPLPGKSIHQIGLVEVSSGTRVIRSFVKANVPNYQGEQKLDIEHQVLTTIAPAISAQNDRLRCPRVLAMFPQEELLFLELIEARDLKSLLFDLVPSRGDLPALLSLTGEWLGRLHRTTQGGEGNPLDCLEERLDGDRIWGTFEKCGVRHLYRSIRHLLQHFRRTHHDLRRPLCQLHGEFTPLHVMVKGDSIYVIDFGSSSRGFAFEDVALFTSFYENLQPWRAPTGWFRVPFGVQKKLFITSYSEHSGQESQRIDDVVARFAGIWAMARHEFFWERPPANWPERAYLSFGRAWMRRRFAALAGRELRKLQTLASFTGSTLVTSVDQALPDGKSGAMFRPTLSPSAAMPSGGNAQSNRRISRN